MPHGGFMKALLLLAVAALANYSSARSLEAIEKTKTIKVAVDGETPSFNAYKGTELVGFEIDIVKEIARKRNWKIEWVVKPFNTLIVALNQDRFDFIATGHAITPERQKAA